MTINDVVYGTFEIDEPVSLELLASAPVQRLKGISQFGMPNRLNATDGFSRFEHCVGVMLLLRKFGATFEEQVAGLLHDVSHTAFSHVVDFVIGQGGAESFQDDNHETYIRRTVIPEILAQHGLSVAGVCDYHQFTLLEQDAPLLCADRLDYSLREMPLEISRTCVEGLTVRDGMFVMKHAEAAGVLARRYLDLQMTRWGGFESSSRYEIFGRVLRQAIDLGVIGFDDFWKDDEYILEKLEVSKDDVIQRALVFLAQRSLVGAPLHSERMRKKFRYVDPLVIMDEQLVPLTKLDAEFARELDAARQENMQGIQIAQFS